MNVMANNLKNLIPDTKYFLEQEMKHFIAGSG